MSAVLNSDCHQWIKGLFDLVFSLRHLFQTLPYANVYHSNRNMKRHPFRRWHTLSSLSLSLSLSALFVWPSVAIHLLLKCFHSPANVCVCIFDFNKHTQKLARIYSLEPATSHFYAMYFIVYIFYTTFVDVRKLYGKTLWLFIGALNDELWRPREMNRREMGSNIKGNNQQNGWKKVEVYELNAAVCR